MVTKKISLIIVYIAKSVKKKLNAMMVILKHIFLITVYFANSY